MSYNIKAVANDGARGFFTHYRYLETESGALVEVESKMQGVYLLEQRGYNVAWIRDNVVFEEVVI